MNIEKEEEISKLLDNNIDLLISAGNIDQWSMNDYNWQLEDYLNFNDKYNHIYYVQQVSHNLYYCREG